jgi:FixJ family two-component response regulator
MAAIGPIVLVDGDVRRRAAICHMLAADGTHVEPFEEVAELSDRLPATGTILVHDDGGSVGRLVHEVSGSGGWLPLIAFAEDPTPEQIVEAIFQGATEYIAWPFDALALAARIETARGRVNTLSSARLREAKARSRIERLTSREREVLGCVAKGLSNRRIGERLAISPRTVEIHRANILNKIGARHTSEAIRIAIEASLVH